VDQSKTVEVRMMQLSSPQSTPVVFAYKFNPEILTGSALAGASQGGETSWLFSIPL